MPHGEDAAGAERAAVDLDDVAGAVDVLAVVVSGEDDERAPRPRRPRAPKRLGDPEVVHEHDVGAREESRRTTSRPSSSRRRARPASDRAGGRSSRPAPPADPRIRRPCKPSTEMTGGPCDACRRPSRRPAWVRTIAPGLGQPPHDDRRVVVSRNGDRRVAEGGRALGDRRLDRRALEGEVADQEHRPVVGVARERRQGEPVGVDVRRDHERPVDDRRAISGGGRDEGVEAGQGLLVARLVGRRPRSSAGRRARAGAAGRRRARRRSAGGTPRSRETGA